MLDIGIEMGEFLGMESNVSNAKPNFPYPLRTWGFESAPDRKEQNEEMITTA
jgi:hypothetical protein